MTKIIYELNLSSLINIIKEYHQAYLKSINKDIDSNSLASLKKGNTNRKKRYEANEKILNDSLVSTDKKLIALYENLILKKFIEKDEKLANLLICLAFILKPQTENLLRKLFWFNKDYLNSLDKLIESLKFYEFTIIAPQKIVNSTAICIYQYLKHVEKIEDEKKILKFIRDTINIEFSEYAPQELRKDMLKRDFYCSGVYNGIPIFQWYVSSDKNRTSYYTNEDIEKYHELVLKLLEDNNVFTKAIYKIYAKDKSSRIDFENKLTSKDGIREIINNLSITYVKNHPKLIEQINKEKRKNSLFNRITSFFK